MQLRTFLAPNMKAALSEVRREMGPEAVIVASERARNGGVMVRAALDGTQSREAEAVAVAEKVLEQRSAEEFSIQDFPAHHHDALMRRLRGEPCRDMQTRKYDRPQFLSILRQHRTPEYITHELAQGAEQSGLSDMTLALASALDRRMKSLPLDLSEAGALLLVGPNGAGKTATAAKLAAHARLSQRCVRLIAGDTGGAGAVERLTTFGEHLGAETLAAENADAMVKLIARSANDDFLAIVDTAGFDPRQPKMRHAFAALAAIDGIETVGVVSATMDAEEAGEIAGALAELGASRLIMTGIDLTRRMGALISACHQGLPLAHIARSPYVAGGLETLTPLSLARLLIESRTSDADRMSPQ